MKGVIIKATFLLVPSVDAERIMSFNLGASRMLNAYGAVKTVNEDDLIITINPETTIAQSELAGNISKTILDRKNRTLSEFIGDKNKLSLDYTYVFDSKGCLIKSISAHDPSHPIISKCDGKNRVIEESTKDGGFNTFKSINWSPDGLSYTKKEMLNGHIDSITVGRYNLQGDEIYYKNTDYNSDDTIKNEEEINNSFVYDNRGNWVQKDTIYNSKASGEKPQAIKETIKRKITYYK